MSTVTSQAPSTTVSSTNPPELELEPDEEWKEDLKDRIEKGLQSMVQDARDNLNVELMKAPVGAQERERLTKEYSDAMTNIRNLAAEGFHTELERERQERRWALGQAMLPQWSQALKEEQQEIMDRIKKSFSSVKPPAPASEARPPATIPKPTPREIPPLVSYPIPELPAELQREREEKERRERERERDRVRDRDRERERDRDRAPLPTHSIRRGSDARASEYSQTFRHATYNLIPAGLYNEPILDNEFTDEPEELLRPPERYRGLSDRPPIHDRAAEAPVSRSIERQPRSVSDRHTTHSPPKPIPEVWKPAITPEDDARMSKPFPLGRRGSTASIRSTGSGGIRPSIAEAIPERADDMTEIAQRRERERVQDVEQEWAPIDKARERERQMSIRNEGRQSAASDHSQRYDDPAVYGRNSTRPPEHHGGSYGPHPRPVRHQTSFTAEEREYVPYGPHQAPPRPLASRTSFNNDERPYIMGMGPYPAPSPARPISHKQSFTNDDHDRYYDPPPSRPYPTPPSSASRAVSRDYGYQDGYDPRADNSYRDREPRSNTWKVAQQMPDSPSLYRRSSESRTIGREPSFSNRRPELGPAEDSYSQYEYTAPTSSIPIMRPRQSPITDDMGQSWKGWAEQPPPRPRDYRYEPDYQRPPYSPDGRPLGPRSPPSSYQAARDVPYHNFGGRSMHEEHEDYFDPDAGTPRYYRDARTDLRRKEESRRDVVEIPRQGEGDAEVEVGRDVEADGDSDPEDQARVEAEVARREEVARKEEDARRKAEDAERKGVEAKRKEEEMKRKEEEMKRKEEEMKRKEEEKKEEARKEEEARRKAEDIERRAAEARRKETEARKLEEDARRKEEEAKKKEEDARRKEQEAERKEAETRKKEREIKKKELEVKRKEAEAKRMEDEARQKEEETKRREADAQRKEAEAKKKEEDAKKREAAARKKTAEAAQKEKETQKKEDEIRQREEELRRREEELARREEESNRKEAEQKQREEEASIREAQRLQAQFDEEAKVKASERRREEEMAQREYAKQREEDRRRAEDERSKRQQQEEFRRREEEIRRRADERKRQDSVGAESTWVPQSSQQQNPAPRGGPQRNGAGSSPSTDRNGASTSSWSSSSSAAWASSTSKTSTASSSTPPARAAPTAPPPTTKPRAGSMGSSFPTSSSPNAPAAPPDSAIAEEEEWQNRQNDYSWRQQEKFREEQAAIEAARLKMGRSKVLSKEEVTRVFARHEHQWESLKGTSELRWRNFPWPMFHPPSTPEDITYRDIDAYIQSPHYPEGDKTKAPKDRIKEQLRNWHPDRFDTKYLPKVLDEEKAVVKEGAGSVVRTLNELMQRVNTPGRSPWSD